MKNPGYNNYSKKNIDTSVLYQYSTPRQQHCNTQQYGIREQQLVREYLREQREHQERLRHQREQQEILRQREQREQQRIRKLRERDQRQRLVEPDLRRAWLLD